MLVCATSFVASTSLPYHENVGNTCGCHIEAEKLLDAEPGSGWQTVLLPAPCRSYSSSCLCLMLNQAVDGTQCCIVHPVGPIAATVLSFIALALGGRLSQGLASHWTTQQHSQYFRITALRCLCAVMYSTVRIYSGYQLKQESKFCRYSKSRPQSDKNHSPGFHVRYSTFETEEVKAKAVIAFNLAGMYYYYHVIVQYYY